MAVKNTNFDKAFKELQSIVNGLQDEDTSIDKLSVKLKKAKELVGFCKTKLREVEADIESIEFDDNED
jgi:exodeoxyribonuclease VII small subunit